MKIYPFSQYHNVGEAQDIICTGGLPLSAGQLSVSSTIHTFQFIYDIHWITGQNFIEVKFF